MARGVLSEEPPGGTIRAQLSARFLDLSVAGAMLHLEAPLAVGAIHDFQLDLAGKAVWVQAEVRRCLPAERGPGFLVGVEFVGVDPHDLEVVRQYLRRAG